MCLVNSWLAVQLSFALPFLGMSVTISRKGVLSVMFIKLTAHSFEKVYFYTEGGHDKICLCSESALSMRCELVFHCLTMDLIFPLLWGWYSCAGKPTIAQIS